MSYKGFRIICLGTYCLPRVIATVTHFKATKTSGEKSCPFDLSFCWNFDAILENLDNEFKNFFNQIEYDYIQNKKVKGEICNIFNSKLNAKFWKNDDAGFIFNHEEGFTFEEFKTRYQTRISNLYEYIKDEEYELYFLIASFNPITNQQIEELNKIVNRYRKPESFYNIILNQSKERFDIDYSNTHIINCSEFNQLFKGDWGLMLKEHEKYTLADGFYSMASKEFKKIILRLS